MLRSTEIEGRFEGRIKRRNQKFNMGCNYLLKPSGFKLQAPDYYLLSISCEKWWDTGKAYEYEEGVNIVFGIHNSPLIHLINPTIKSCPLAGSRFRFGNLLLRSINVIVVEMWSLEMPQSTNLRTWVSPLFTSTRLPDFREEIRHEGLHEFTIWGCRWWGRGVSNGRLRRR